MWSAGARFDADLIYQWITRYTNMKGSLQDILTCVLRTGIDIKVTLHQHSSLSKPPGFIQFALGRFSHAFEQHLLRLARLRRTSLLLITLAFPIGSTTRQMELVNIGALVSEPQMLACMSTAVEGDKRDQRLQESRMLEALL
jgi:hypothetical protein